MICVDSSVWISRLRRQSTAAASRLEQIIRTLDDQVLVGDLVLLEVLRGARDQQHSARIERNLRSFHLAPMLGEALAPLAASHYRLLRGQGITIRKTIDLIIGTFCIAHGHILLHDDRDFTPMAEHLGLNVLAV